jgi:hypothetical protein
MVGTSQPCIANLGNGNANRNGGAVGKILPVLGFRFVLGNDSLVSERKLPYKNNILPHLCRGFNIADLMDIDALNDVPI